MIRKQCLEVYLNLSLYLSFWIFLSYPVTVEILFDTNKRCDMLTTSTNHSILVIQSIYSSDTNDSFMVPCEKGKRKTSTPFRKEIVVWLSIQIEIWISETPILDTKMAKNWNSILCALIWLVKMIIINMKYSWSFLKSYELSAFLWLAKKSPPHKNRKL